MQLFIRVAAGACFASWLAACNAQAPYKSTLNAPSAQSIQPREGKVSVTGGQVWYRIVGSGNGTPLLLLHGGPGVPSDYLEPFNALGDDRPVIFYDQLGCGKSDRPDDTTLWRVDRFVDELAQVRRALKLEKVHLYGHSWGAMLAVDYLLTKPDGVEGLILASPLISSPRWITDQDRYREALPKEVEEVLRRHERAGTTDSTEYKEAAMEFYKRHLCRLDPFPDAMGRAMEGEGRAVYHAMWGPSEFHATGNLKNHDLTDRLRELSTPTLFTCGLYDGATPESTRFFQHLRPGSELIVFQKSAHVAHLEETDNYLNSIRQFLRQLDNTSSSRFKRP